MRPKEVKINLSQDKQRFEIISMMKADLWNRKKKSVHVHVFQFMLIVYIHIYVHIYILGI